MSRAYTAEEVRDIFLRHIRGIADFWANLPDKSPKERCDGVAFSILNIVDGNTLPLPALDICLSPHPEDKAYNQENGNNWFEEGMVINNCQLHDHYYEKNK
jgi:hypothetical protein